MILRRFIAVAFLVIILVVACAKRGMPTGGPKDAVAPKLLMSEPQNNSVNFNQKQIKLYFNENVTLKDVDKQLIISPPLKNKPNISPTTGSAKKYVTITLSDTLQPNTTYSFNFGKSIVDATEANPLPNGKYQFSTGNFIDSLKLSGFVKDAELKKTIFPISVFLYDVNESFNDSVIYNKNPRYIATTTDSLNTFTIENIKEGKYLLVSIKDANDNFRFDPLKEKMAFHKQVIRVPNDTIYKLDLFKEKPSLKINKPTQTSGNQLILGYRGDFKNPDIKIKNGNDIIPSIYTQFPKKDSLQIWYQPIKTDSIIVSINHPSLKKSEEYTIKLKEKKNDSINIRAQTLNGLHLRETFTLISNTPLKKHNQNKIFLFKTDSTKVAFKTNYSYNNRTLEIIFEKEPATKYQLVVEPSAFEDWFGNINTKQQKFSFDTKSTNEYGNLKVNVKTNKSFPLIIQLTNEKGEILAEQIIDKAQSVEFNYLLPNKYLLRAVSDENKNGIWDTGNYLQKQQPEEIYYFPKPIDVRMNWDIDQNFEVN
jgi:uncharacterized protein (DUF2141 family)